jgi:sugar phosphate isomerase/epimerase
MRIGMQLFTLRDHTGTEAELAETLRKVKAIGYEGVQLSAVRCMEGDAPEVDARRAREHLDEAGLVCCVTHRPWDRLSEHTAAEIEFHRELGCDLCAIATPPACAWTSGPDGFRRLARDMSRVARALQSAEMSLGFHNHAREFSPLSGDEPSPFDILLQDLDPAVFFLLDVYWVRQAGQGVVGLVSKLPGRLPAVHAKDGVGTGDRARMTPVGEGDTDWKPLLAALERAGTRWLLVEQDTCDRDPFDCAASSYRFLAKALRAGT